MSKSILFVLIVSFFIATIIGPVFIPFLHRLKFGQAIREEGPQSHRKKSSTNPIAPNPTKVKRSIINSRLMTV